MVDKRDYHKPGIRFPGTTVQPHNREWRDSAMPANPTWLLHLPEIVAQLEVFDVPVVDRAIVERVFGLGRRRAIELLHRFGGYQAGRTFLIDRRLLIDHLRAPIAGEEFQQESRRKERLAGMIDQVRRHQAAAAVKIPVSPESWNRRIDGLPP